MSTALLRTYAAVTSLAPWLLRYAATSRHRKQNAPEARLPERLGTPSKQRPDGPLIWLHASSVGEVQSVADLARLLSEDATLLVTTTTQTGAERVAKALPESVIHQYQPIDTTTAISSFLDHWQPDLAGFVEGDLWPRTLGMLSARGIPTALLNARPSRTRSRFGKSYGQLLRPLSLITTQSPTVLEDLAGLGVPETRLRYFGDLKADAPAPAISGDALAAFRSAAQGRPIWAAVSTHPDDEPQVIAAHQQLLKARPDTLLLWLPRHPDRATALCAGAAAHFRIARRSLGDAVTADTQVLVADTLGEAGAAFTVAPVVFLGGSFGEEGGHNPYEAAKLGAFTLSGPRIANFQTAYARLSAEGYAHIVTDSTALADALQARFNGAHKAPWEAGSKDEQPTANTFAQLQNLITQERHKSR